eukprot:CAMPEP_0206597022 /NCGR_PEP_ID=MMETSP0325_2-20121206/43882_1 /ASSEMBLY_ACC=CAM_ASM_000347 /TAXON_ID=2866 /ORGANISM="Crypthecodinium cohnii, Strain Seligo" /LENGTH=1141 /DNA_ID=CAMNT_0054107915 /DNA_START=157 /DNA_END=3583 /DNA_ORIENTATION=-
MSRPIHVISRGPPGPMGISRSANLSMMPVSETSSHPAPAPAPAPAVSPAAIQDSRFDVADTSAGWDSLLEASCGYVASVQQMLQSACDAADSAATSQMPIQLSQPLQISAAPPPVATSAPPTITQCHASSSTAPAPAAPSQAPSSSAATPADEGAGVGCPHYQYQQQHIVPSHGGTLPIGQVFAPSTTNYVLAPAGAPTAFVTMTAPATSPAASAAAAAAAAAATSSQSAQFAATSSLHAQAETAGLDFADAPGAVAATIAASNLAAAATTTTTTTTTVPVAWVSAVTSVPTHTPGSAGGSSQVPHSHPGHHPAASAWQPKGALGALSDSRLLAARPVGGCGSPQQTLQGFLASQPGALQPLGNACQTRNLSQSQNQSYSQLAHAPVAVAVAWPAGDEDNAPLNESNSGARFQAADSSMPVPVPADAATMPLSQSQSQFQTGRADPPATDLLLPSSDPSHSMVQTDSQTQASASSSGRLQAGLGPAEGKVDDSCRNQGHSVAGSVGSNDAASTMVRVQEVSSEVLRLRLLKSQHEELLSQLHRAQTQLRKLSLHAVIQTRSYFEQNLKDVILASQLQEAAICLLQCLGVVCKIECSVLTPEAMLVVVRRMFRDPHNFTSRLCSMPIMTSLEAKELAPYLLPCMQFKRVREKEVNESIEALSAWLTAFHLYSSISDQVAPVGQDLEKQERLLRQLSSQGDEAGGPPRRLSTGNASATLGTGTTNPISSGSGSGTAGNNGLRCGGRTPSPVRSTCSSNITTTAASGTGATGTAAGSPPPATRFAARQATSPNQGRTSRLRNGVASSPQTQTRAIAARSKFASASNAEGHGLYGSRSTSPLARRPRFQSSPTGTGASPARPRPPPTSASGAISASPLSPSKGSPAAQGGSGAPNNTTTNNNNNTNNNSSSNNNTSRRTIEASASASVLGSPPSEAAVTLNDYTLQRVQSERLLSRSPRPQRRSDSRSISQGPNSQAAPLRPGGGSGGGGGGGAQRPTSRALLPATREREREKEREGSKASAASMGPTSSGGAKGGGHSTHSRAAPPSLHSSSGIPPPKSPPPKAFSSHRREGAVEENSSDPVGSGEHRSKRVTSKVNLADSGSESDGDELGPHRRKLSQKQYEALVRCAQRVVQQSGMPPPCRS